MYIVLLGTPDSELEQEDFTAYGPFDTKEAAVQWVRERASIAGDDALDTPFFIHLSNPIEVLRELRVLSDIRE